jgi:hypothetical protein
MRKNENFIVIDTETAGSVNYPLPYDCGYKVMNRKGEVLAIRSYVVAEIYCDEPDMMKSAYYAEKLPQYAADLKTGKRTLARLATIRRQVLADMENFKTTVVYAYNMNFDRRALNNVQKFVTKKYSIFFPENTEFRCIWNMACQVLLARPSYIKFALENGFVSAKGNILTNAECCYRYITKNVDFMEEHRGLEDVNIEAEILLKCFAQHKKMDTRPYSACWMMVQQKQKEIMGA